MIYFFVEPLCVPQLAVEDEATRTYVMPPPSSPISILDAPSI